MILFTFATLALSGLSSVVGSPTSGSSFAAQNGLSTISYDDPLIYKTGRWDNNQTSWWGGHGVRLHFSPELTDLYLNLGEATTPAPAEISISVDYGDWFQSNFTVGINKVNLTGLSTKKDETHVIRLATESYEGFVNVWTSVRMQLEEIYVNKAATLLEYTPAPIEFEFIGDSISSGCYSTQGQVTGWAFLSSEYFKVEHNQLTQPGACLSTTADGCYGNFQGMETLYFQTQNSDYEYIPALNNMSTPWNFSHYSPPGPTHIFIMLGTNDYSNNITDATFLANYKDFVAHIRTIYAHQPIFIISDLYQSFNTQEQQVVEYRNSLGDKEVFFIDTTGWVNASDPNQIIPDNGHPTSYGQTLIAAQLESHLEDWGLKPFENWATPL